MAAGMCGRMGVDMMASDGGANAWAQDDRSSPNNAFDGRPLAGRLWLFSPIDLTPLGLGRIAGSRADGRPGVSLCLDIPAVARRCRLYRISAAASGIPAGARSFVIAACGRRAVMPSYRTDGWVVAALKQNS